MSTTRNTFTFPQRMKLVDHLRSHLKHYTTEHFSITQVAQHASAILGFPVSHGNISSLMGSTPRHLIQHTFNPGPGIAAIQANRAASQDLSFLAQVVCLIHDEFGPLSTARRLTEPELARLRDLARLNPSRT